MLSSGLLLSASVLEAQDAAPRFDATNVKAAFVFSFGRYIEWPPDRFLEPSTPFVIGLTPHADFGPELRAIVRSRMLHGRSVRVEEVRNVDDAKKAHLLFIAREDQRLLADELVSLASGGVVTVSDAERFEKAGGMLALFVEGERLRFRMNPELKLNRHVRVSSQLLKLAAPPKD